MLQDELSVELHDRILNTGAWKILDAALLGGRRGVIKATSVRCGSASSLILDV